MRNHLVAVSGIIARKYKSDVVINRIVIDQPLSSQEMLLYKSLVPSKLGRTATVIKFKEDVHLSYN